MQRRLLAAAALLAASTLGLRPAGAAETQLKLEKGDHLALVGSALADRMQHDGWLETLVQSRFPQHELVVRDLGFAGDELTQRMRSQDFGTPEQWLTRTGTDVVLAFYGYNESFAGEAGIAKFRNDLQSFVNTTLSKKYDGATPARLVLFSPVAHENLKDGHHPDGVATNKNLKLYADAMAEVAKAANVPFVDLFTPSLELYAKADKPLTVNGVHLNERGNKAIAEVIDKALFGGAGPSANDDAKLQALRKAVLDKNLHWYNRYRTTDGYSIYGGRADLKFTDDQTNRVVMQREMEILDVLTANRDKAIWAVAQGQAAKVDDSNTPPFVPVKTNKPGAGPGGAHQFLSGEESVKRMKPGKDLKVNLFASEEQFPELVNPVQMAWDTKGRLWVAVWPTYPHWTPKGPMNDKLLILEDTDKDGRADKCTTFVDNLHNPTGFEFYGDGVIVAQAPALVFLKDTDGDGKADVRERVLEGLDTADTHHAANSFVLDPGGALYFQEGTFHHSQIESPWGPPERVANGAVFRFEPRTSKADVYVTYGFANPHGHAFDRWGRDVVFDGTSAVPYYGPSFSGKLYYPQKHDNAPTVYKPRTRPCAGAETLSSRAFPEEYQGNLLVANVIGFLGIQNYKLTEEGAGVKGTEVEPIVQSDDQNFRPSDIEVGPDGAIYFTDWHNPIIGHMQHNLRDPSRDKTHGRVYRVVHTGREPNKQPAKIAGEPVEKLLDLLKDSEDRVRYRARIELGGRKSAEVIPALSKWVAALDKSDKDYEHHMTEALWLHQNLDVVNEELLKRNLRSPDYHARAAATRVLCYWRDRVAAPLELLRPQVNDENPRVRLEAVRACSFFQDPKAAELALESVNHPQDRFLEYCLDQTMKTLEKFTK